MSPPWKTGVAEDPIALLKKNSNKATGLRLVVAGDGERGGMTLRQLMT
jgi:hypothetical protein